MKIAVAYTHIVTISTDNVAVTREFRASVGVDYVGPAEHLSAGAHCHADEREPDLHRVAVPW